MSTLHEAARICPRPAAYRLGEIGLILVGNRFTGCPGRDGGRLRMIDATIGDPEHVALMQRIVALKLEHRDLDGAIQRLGESPLADQLQLTRMKRRKLLIKDQIAWLERQLDPDQPA